MRLTKFLAVAFVAAVSTIPVLAHPGPERHPTEQELDSLASELRAEVEELERRLTQLVESVNSLTNEPSEEALLNAVDNAISEMTNEVTQSLTSLEERVEEIAANSRLSSGSLLAGLALGIAGLAMFVARRLRTLQKRISKSPSQQSDEPVESTSEPIPEGEQEAEAEEENREQIKVRRIVTHTLKDPATRKILELHNPDAEWSPRRVEDAIEEILDLERNIEYFSRGPKGNEALIEVKYKNGKPHHLQTMPDQHGGNNLSELPDPP